MTSSTTRVQLHGEPGFEIWDRDICALESEPAGR